MNIRRRCLRVGCPEWIAPEKRYCSGTCATADEAEIRETERAKRSFESAMVGDCDEFQGYYGVRTEWRSTLGDPR